jgi:hypothetical protein
MKAPVRKNGPEFRTVLIIIAPSAILFIGCWLVGMAAFVLLQGPFLPSMIIMVGGTAVVVTIALVALVFIDRPKETGVDSRQLPNREVNDNL